MGRNLPSCPLSSPIQVLPSGITFESPDSHPVPCLRAGETRCPAAWAFCSGYSDGLCLPANAESGRRRLLTCRADMRTCPPHGWLVQSPVSTQRSPARVGFSRPDHRRPPGQTCCSAPFDLRHAPALVCAPASWHLSAPFGSAPGGGGRGEAGTLCVWFTTRLPCLAHERLSVGVFEGRLELGSPISVPAA